MGQFYFGRVVQISIGTDNDKGLVAKAYFAWSAYHLSRMAGELENIEDNLIYQRLFDDVRAAFVQHYVSETGRVDRENQTAYALIICFGLYMTERQREVAVQRLCALVEQSGYHITTGFVGTPLVSKALCLRGYPQTTFR